MGVCERERKIEERESGGERVSRVRFSSVLVAFTSAPAVCVEE
jgi:hypothetical protein